MLHLTCGDLAGDGVRALLAGRDPQARVRVMRDDLAVGPLSGIETPPCAVRVAFWERVWPEKVTPRPGFARELAGAGQLELRGDPAAGYRDLQVRRLG